MASDPYGRAIGDHYRDEREEPLYDRDGDAVREHPIEDFYFFDFRGESGDAEWIASRLDGPLLDLGAGAGSMALYFQEQYETVAVDVSEHLVEVMGDRGVEDARVGDMFALREQFERDRFRSVLSHGTQLGLAGSMERLRRFLTDLAFVTTPDASAVVDAHDPESDGLDGLFAARPDPTPGLGYRVLHFEYEGDVGETLLFRLFSPWRLREAANGAGWTVAEVDAGDENPYYRAHLTKG